MKNRKPYDLKLLLAVYNLAQVIACCYLVLGILISEPNIIKFWQTQNFGSNPKSVPVMTYGYLTFYLKLVEYVETVFFVLRKKQNQVSFLHVYHHISSASMAWIMPNVSDGGFSFSFSICFNGHI